LARRKNKIKSSVADKVELVILYILIIFITCWFVIPFLWMFFSSFKTNTELFEMKLFPNQIQFENYKAVFEQIPFFLYLKNTLIIVFFNIIGSVVSSAWVAYGFSRLRWKFREQVFGIVLVTMVLPFQVTMIPLFIIFQNLGWIGTFLPLTVTAFFGNAFYIFLIRQFFIGLPQELSEAAKVDGASDYRIFLQILVPLSRPVLVTVCVFAFMKTWNDYIGPLVFLADKDLYTLSLAAQLLKSNLDPNWDLLMAMGTMMTLPVLIIFFCLQKYFIQGISMSGIKG
jgi:multiple sugar transport system permease protein